MRLSSNPSAIWTASQIALQVKCNDVSLVGCLNAACRLNRTKTDQGIDDKRVDGPLRFMTVQHFYQKLDNFRLVLVIAFRPRRQAP